MVEKIRFYVNISPEVIIKIDALLEKFPSSIKWLEINGKWSSIIDFIDIRVILDLVSKNVNTLKLECIYLTNKDECKKELNLYHLKSLPLHFCGMELEVIFSRLPAGINIDRTLFRYGE